MLRVIIIIDTKVVASDGFIYRYLSRTEMVDRFHSLQHENKLSRLRSKLNTAIAKQSVTLDEQTSNDIVSIMHEEESRVAGICLLRGYFGTTTKGSRLEIRQKRHSPAPTDDKVVSVPTSQSSVGKDIIMKHSGTVGASSYIRRGPCMIIPTV